MRGQPQEVVGIKAVKLMKKDVKPVVVVSNMSLLAWSNVTYEASFSSVSQIRV